MKLKKIIFLLFLLPLILQSASISPSGINLSKKRSATLQIRNDSDSNEIYTAELLKVVHTKDGYTKLESSEDLTIFPPIIRLQPKKSRKVKVFKTNLEPIYGRYFIKFGSLSGLQSSNLEEAKITTVSAIITIAKYIRIDINENDSMVDKSAVDFDNVQVFNDKMVITINNTSNNFLRIKNPCFLLALDGSDITKKFLLENTIEILPKHKIDYSFKFTKDIPKILFEKNLTLTHVNYKIKNIEFVDYSVKIKYQ